MKKIKSEEEVTTIDELAVMIKNGFQSTQDHFDRKFEQMDNKFESKFSEVNYKLDKIDTKLGGQEKTVFNHDREIDKLKVDMKGTKGVLKEKLGVEF